MNIRDRVATVVAALAPQLLEWVVMRRRGRRGRTSPTLHHDNDLSTHICPNANE